jgi:hypothetical protein
MDEANVQTKFLTDTSDEWVAMASLLGDMSMAMLAQETNMQCRIVKALKAGNADASEVEAAVAKLLDLKKRITVIDPDHRLATTRKGKAKRRATKQARKGKATVRATAMKAEADAAEEYAIAVAQNPSQSHRHRVFAFREFILASYKLCTGSIVLDIAGGKGELSWLLANADGVDSIVVDPRVIDCSSLEKSVDWMRANSSKAAVDGCWVYQQKLAGVLSKEGATFTRPRHLRAFVDANMVNAVTKGGNDAEWSSYWAAATECAEREEFDQHHKVFDVQEADFNRQRRVFGATEAHAVLSGAALLVGFHPDQVSDL